MKDLAKIRVGHANNRTTTGTMFNKFRVLFTVLPFLFAMLQCQKKEVTLPIYEVSYFQGMPDWNNTPSIKTLTAPWNNHEKDQTLFQAAYNDTAFFFRFNVVDQSQDTYDSTKEQSVALGDRVEMFFSRNLSLDNYYCLELSPNGKILDYQASSYRKFDPNWNLQGLQVYTTQTKSTYIIRGTIPITFFQSLTTQSSNNEKSVYFGLFRAERSIEAPKDEFIWYTWKTPTTEHPDFHIPSAFGMLLFKPKQIEK